MASNTSHPFLDPLWRRIVLIAVCAVWAIIEFMNGNMFWFSMVGALTVYGAYSYLYAYTPSDRGKSPTIES